MTRTRFEVMDVLNEHDIPCGPILSMKELIEEPSLRGAGRCRGRPPDARLLRLVGNPSDVRQSDRSDALTAAWRAPQEILRDVLGFDYARIAELERSGAIA